MPLRLTHASLAATLAAFLSGAALEARAGEPVDLSPDLVTEKYGERRAYFGPVLASCRPGGYCSALTYVGARGDFYDYAVRVGSPAPGAPYEVVFTAVEEYVPDNGPITVSVDNLYQMTFPAHEAGGWTTEQGKGVNEHVFAAAAANSALLPAMKRGYRMRVSFPRGDGVDAININSHNFSLAGLSAALVWIEGNRLR